MDDIIVDIPNVGQVAFPASMSQDEINAAAKRLYEQNQPRSTQQELVRQLGLTGRAAISGIADLPNLIADPLYKMVGATPPSQGMQQALTQMGFPKPETATERYIQSGARALSGAGAQLGAAGQIATQAASPVVRGAAETFGMFPSAQMGAAAVSAPAAEMVTEATESPLAGLAAGIAAGGAAGIRPRRIEPVPAPELLAKEAAAAYKRAEQAGVIVKPSSIQNFSGNVASMLTKEGYRPRLHPQLAAVLDEIAQEGSSPKTLEQLETLRRVIKSPAGQFDNPDQQRLAKKMVTEFDRFVDSLSGKDLLAGNASEAVASLKDARTLYARNKKSDLIDEIVEKANLSESQYSQSGMENALRVQFRALAKNKTKMAQFSKDEQDQIRQIVKGTTGQNILRFVGKFGSPSVVSLAGGGGLGYLVGGAPGAVALPLIGAGARESAARMGIANVDALTNMIRLGRPPQVTQPRLMMTPQTLMRGLLSSQME